MIFATVGTQLPFPRFLDALDRCAARHDVPVIAQTCEEVRGRPHVTEQSFMPPAVFERHAAAAELIVGHAGIGTVLAAKRHGKPLILFPRRAARGEHRNDHQMATAKALASRPGIHVAYDDDELDALIARRADLPSVDAERPAHAGELIERVAAFLDAAR